MPTRRPRINEDLAASIDAVRGNEPLERWIEDALEVYLMVFVEEARPRRPKARYSERHEILWNLLRNDWFMMQWKDFQAAIDRVHEMWQAEMDEQAREDEMYAD